MKSLVNGAAMPCLTFGKRTTANWTLRLVAFTALATVAGFASSPANAAEHSLAGIRIFATVHEVLAKFGEPTQVLTGEDAITGAPSATTGNTSSNGANTQNPDGGPMPPSGRPPEFSGNGRNTGYGSNNNNNNQSSSTQTDDPAQQEAMYIYQKPTGVTYEFLLSPDGRVIQITVLGYKGAVKTSRNIGLASGIGTVISKYGYPESQETNNGVLEMKYLDKQHIAFELRQNKVVGIIVAAVE